MLPKDKSKKCALVMHTQPVDDNGTDLPAVVKELCPDYDVIFSNEKLDNDQMCWMYNIADVTINIASNEGFGLGSCEMLHTGGVIVVNVTGGLQDQCGFKKDGVHSQDGKYIEGDYLTAEDYVELQSNHRGTYTNHGEWVKPVFPSNISCQGSPLTPYIFDDRASFEDAGEALLGWYNVGPEERERCGEVGRQFVLGDGRMTGKAMSESFIKNIDTTLEKWKPREKYTLEVC